MNILTETVNIILKMNGKIIFYHSKKNKTTNFIEFQILIGAKC